MAAAVGSISASGHALPSVQPVSGSVIGSPFTITGSASKTPEIKESGVIISSDEDVHIAFNADATSIDIILYANQWFHFPIVSGDTISFLKASLEDATVYVQAQREVV